MGPTDDGKVVGHVMFSPLQVGDVTGAALAPMAVLPAHQGEGIGSQPRCPFIIVVGHANYYPRFGFTPARARGISCEWDVADDAFMLLVLDHARMASVSGQAVYRPEFTTVTLRTNDLRRRPLFSLELP